MSPFALSAPSQAHRVTAQFCIWDHLKALKGQQGRRVANLARLVAALILSKALPFTALRVSTLLHFSSQAFIFEKQQCLTASKLSTAVRCL